MNRLVFLGWLGCLYSAAAWAGIGFHRMEATPSALVPPASSPGGSSVVEETLTFPSLQLRADARNEMRAVLPGTRSLLVDRMPEVPMVLRQIPLSGRQAVVTFEKMVLEESDQVVSLKKVPDSFVWTVNHDLSFNSEPSGRYFPGKFYEAKEAAGVLNIVIFPVQVDRETGKVITLRSVVMKVAFSGERASGGGGASWGSEGLILTTESLRSAAALLQNFHGRNLQVRSDIVTVESIAASESPIAESELPAGYKVKQDAASVVHAYDPAKRTGYNYELARKIISFLRKKMSSGTKYVTILGDANAVPPSYYFAIRSGFGNKWGVTDLCYGAVKECTEAKMAVGRLPFTSEDEVRNYLSKVTRWLDYSGHASSELALFGGKAFPVDVFIGELGTLKTLNSDKASWRGVKKYYRTRKNYAKQSVLDLVNGQVPSSFVYYLDHGNGNQWHVEREYVSSTEILNATSPGNVNPLVVSIACTNAAFDNELVKEQVLSGSNDGKVAVGVALLKSKAGAVAYLGSGRPALGAPVYDIDDHGNLNLTGTTYGLQMFDTFYEKYHKAGGGRLGDIVLAMYRAYLTENGNDLENERNMWTYWNVVLLGDPAMPLPRRSQPERAYPFAKSSVPFKPGQFGGFPRFLFKDQGTLDLVFQAATEVRATLMKMASSPFGGGSEEVVEEKTQSGAAMLPVKLGGEKSEGQYFLRLENAEGVPLERQVWFTVDKEE